MLKNNADQIRLSLRTARSTMTAEQRKLQSQLVCAHLQHWIKNLALHTAKPPLVIAAFWPLIDEPDITPILHLLAERGHQVVLPVVAIRHAPLEFHVWHPHAPMKAGNFGVMEPHRTGHIQPNVFLVPTLGFTRQADRLGYGGGYYDRTLAAMHRHKQTPTTIGIAWNEGLLNEKFPDYLPQSHDMPLQAVLTALGWAPHAP